MSRINAKRKHGRYGKLEYFQKTSSENVLGALFLQLPTIQKYTGFEVSLTEMTLVRWQIKLTEGFVVKQIY